METFNNILRSVWGVSLAVLFFGFTIFIHELGHFLAAKKRGLKVERFSIGFGPRIWGWTGKDGVDYRISLFPLGGYVALPQMADMSAVEGETLDDSEKLPKVGYADKMIVAVMGATFNVLFAVVLACLLSIFGRPMLFDEGVPVVGYVETEIQISPKGDKVPAPALKAELKFGDRITAVDGNPVASFQEVTTAVATGTLHDDQERPLTLFTVERDGKPLPEPVRLTPVRADRFGSGDFFRTVGIKAAEPVYVDVEPTSPAAKGGMQPGDRILAINGAPVYSFDHFRDQLAAAVPGGENPSPIAIEIERGPKDGPLVKQTLQVTPEIVPFQNAMLALEFTESGARRRVELVPSPENPYAHGAEKAPRDFLMVRAGLPPESAFAEALATGNVITLVDGAKQVGRPADFESVIASAKAVKEGNPVTLYLKSETSSLNVAIPGAVFSVIPPKTRSLIGIVPAPSPVKVRKAPWVYLGDTFSSTFGTLKSLLSPKSDVGVKHLTGVIGISRIYYTIADNIMGVVWITLVLNVNLAVMNLLPLPVLDGGHMVYATIDKIRGRPLPRRFVEILQTSFVVILFGLMAFVLWRDLSRWKAGNDVERQDVVDAYVLVRREFGKHPAPAPKSGAAPAANKPEPVAK